MAQEEDEARLPKISNPSLHRGVSVITGECLSDCFVSNTESRLVDQDGTERERVTATQGRRNA